MHKVTSPRRKPSRRIEWMMRVVRTAPVAPIGWPCAIAPPSTLSDVLRQAELARHDDGDGRERFVDFDPLDVAEPPAGYEPRSARMRGR